MLFVDNSDVDTFFHLSTGGEHPFWSVSGDSDALRLGGSVECSDIACKLNPVDAAKIRSLTSEPQEVPCSLSYWLAVELRTISGEESQRPVRWPTPATSWGLRSA